MPSVRIDELEIFYRLTGNGPDVVLVHGWCSSGRMWKDLVERLSHRYRFISPDLPGFGRSAKPENGWYSVSGYTEMIRAFVDKLHIRPLAMVGHSMGGAIAIKAAYQWPDMFERLALVCPAVTGRLNFSMDIFLVSGVGRTLMTLSQRIWPLAFLGVMSEYVSPRHLGNRAVRRIIEDLEQSDWNASYQSLYSMTQTDLSPLLPHIAHPTLIISGARDLTLPPEDARRAAAALPNAELHVFENSHHQPLDEEPDRFTRVFEAFMERPVGVAVVER